MGRVTPSRLYVACSSLVALAACSPSSTTAPAPASDTCEPYESDADLSSPPVLFGENVLPIFESNCAVGGGSCHGAGNASPYLGAPDGGVDAATILASIVGVDSGEDPEMDYVAPNEPQQSYLMHKIDGDQCTLAQACALSIYSAEYGDCGESMPFLPHRLLPVSTRDQVRAWIFQGAQNN